MLRLTLHDSDAMCPGKDITLFVLDLLVAVIEIYFFKARNTLWKWVVPTRSHLIALWRYFTRLWILQMLQLVSDTCLMTVTISVVRIP
jgi:hypothetical protein